ncbi:hypothetical protein M8J75_014754 [Diaphorina citri]|nr:hypothetical protein M8J75_014754 [Diaphorina citri]
MNSRSLIVCVIMLAEISSISARKLPSFIPSCKRSDPNLNECAMRVAAAARPHLAKGIPKIKVPAMEPLIINELQVNRNNENLMLKLKLKNSLLIRTDEIPKGEAVKFLIECTPQ